MKRLWPLLLLPALLLPELALDPFRGGLSPSLHHWLGTDALGRDALLRLLLTAAQAGAFASLCALAALALGWIAALTGPREAFSALRAAPALLWLIPLADLVGGLERPALGVLVSCLLAPALEAPLRVKADQLRLSPAWNMGRVQGASPLRRLRAWSPWTLQQAAPLFPTAWLGALWAEVTLSALGLGPGPQADSFGRLLMEALPQLATGAAFAWTALATLLVLAWSLSFPEHAP